jgi:bacterioferritin
VPNVKGDKRIVDRLNDVLTGELTAASQYFLHAKMFLNWGYAYLGGKIYKESIDEMRHADKLVERILFLEGLPNLQKLGTLAIGQSATEILKSDLSLELATVPRLNEAVGLCRELGDNGSEELLMGILVDSEKHVDWLESQLRLVEQVGEKHYLAQQFRE